MKDGRFEVGDEVECVEFDSGNSITIGNRYVVREVSDTFVKVNNKKHTGILWIKESRFKLIEPAFTHEYFSALNEKDAEKYIGKVMEFADRVDVKAGIWFKYTFTDIVNATSCYVYRGGNTKYSFMRTCPETFQKKKVKKTIECWANVYPVGSHVFHSTKYIADKCQGILDKRIACVKLTGEYEVEE